MSKQADSLYIKEAFQIIDSVRGKPQEISERGKIAIDLAALLLKESKRIKTRKEKKEQKLLAKMMNDSKGKAFTTAFADEILRSKSKKRIANHISHLLQLYGIPKYLNFFQRIGLQLFRAFSPTITKLLVPFVTKIVRKQMQEVILPGEHEKLIEHIKKRKEEGVRLNINHIGEAILGEKEAKKRLQVYLDDLKQDEIDYVSIKISSIFSQISLLAWDFSVTKIAEKLRKLFRASMDHPRKMENGEEEYKFVNLDMEEYHDLHLTVDVFLKVLEEPEFHELSAGIVLQAYIPESFLFQEKITEWAKERVKNGGAPIKVRIVKGANLANEQVEASIKNWNQAPYTSKADVDANYKKMLQYGLIPENVRAVHLGIASHNLFDVSFALLLRAENQVEAYCEIEMLEGMASHIRRAVQKITGEILLYCPVAKKDDLPHAISYLIRRLDENTREDNFLRHLFHLKVGSEEWDAQGAAFLESCETASSVSNTARRNQNRNEPLQELELFSPFDNEPDTDFSSLENRAWAEKILERFQNYKPDDIPLIIGEEHLLKNKEGTGFNPAHPGEIFYSYCLAKKEDIHKAIEIAKDFEKTWGKTSLEERCILAKKAAAIFRNNRDELLGLMMLDTGKSFLESDPEISEGIDNIEYYYRQLKRYAQMKDISISPKGTALVTPPWNFPFAIPVGGIIAALLSGNCVIFKPAPQAVLVGSKIIQTLHEAGFPKKALQFVNCLDDPEGSLLVSDKRIDKVFLTGSTETAKIFLKLKPSINLSAETGGKNSMILTALCDKDLAIKDLLHSAFSHSGQKCSAVSVAILEQELYDDIEFLNQLKNAAKSLPVGPATKLSSKVVPLIEKPNKNLQTVLTKLEDGQSWLLEPKQDENNPNLYSPGIVLGVKQGSFLQQTELFAPILALVKAKDLNHAIEIANATPYGLTAGIHSLDLREQHIWKSKIEAGNLYINRTTTGAIVQRQPFGGCKNSSFGKGIKAGGPDFILEGLSIEQVSIPKEKQPVNNWVNNLTSFLENIELTAEELGMWYASVSNYSYWYRRLRHDRDATKIVGQDNYLKYVPIKGVVLRISKNDNPFDALRSLACALTCECPLEISFDSKLTKSHGLNWLDLIPILTVVDEDEDSFLQRISSGKIKRVRVLSTPSAPLLEAAADAFCHVASDPVLANGRIELLHYLREVATSINYHRYGYLGGRENELRKPIF
ncbi:MAG: proline dehydrogenase family protein [Chlamydiota bacterium]|jgi:RHH-type proline utilization regulon transcriptional repressor/proline dehydrogenase/delta 1-pyrroline-5-carboxylate dehydrogenase